MRFYRFLLVIFIGIFAEETAAYIDTPSVSPSVILPTGLARLLFEGSEDNPEGKISCYIVLYGMPGFQNAQAQGACYDAQTACVRLGLFQQFMLPQKNEEFVQMYPGTYFSQEELKKAIHASMQEVSLKLVGCAVATAASVITDSVIDQAGFVSPQEEKQRKNSSLPSSQLSLSPSSDAMDSSSDSSLDPLPEESQEEKHPPQLKAL